MTSSKAKSEKKVRPASRAKSFVHLHSDGTIWAKGKTLNGKATGHWEWFRKDGVIMRSGHFEKGKPAGEWITYDRRGKVYKVTQKTRE